VKGFGLLAGFFNQSFWQNFVSTLVGTLIALVGAYGIYRVQERRQQRATERAKLGRERQILHLIKDAVEKNRKLVEQMQRDLQTMAVTYNVDLVPLDWLITQADDFIDLALFRQTTSLRYELSHLHTQVKLQLALGTDPNLRHIAYTPTDGPETVAYPALWNNAVAVIQAHIPTILRECQELDATLKTLLSAWS
jgi:uncharacterized membrane protein YccC